MTINYAPASVNFFTYLSLFKTEMKIVFFTVNPKFNLFY